MLFNLFKKKPTKNEGLNVDYFGNQIQKPIDPSVDRIFKIGAILVIGYIMYNAYRSENIAPAETISEEAQTAKTTTLTEEQVDLKVQEAFKIMRESAEFKKVSEFVNLMEGKSKAEKPEILQAGNGYTIYIPKKLIDESLLKKEDIKIGSESVEFEIITSPKIKKPIKTEKSTSDSAKKAH